METHLAGAKTVDGSSMYCKYQCFNNTSTIFLVLIIVVKKYQNCTNSLKKSCIVNSTRQIGFNNWVVNIYEGEIVAVTAAPSCTFSYLNSLMGDIKIITGKINHRCLMSLPHKVKPVVCVRQTCGESKDAPIRIFLADFGNTDLGQF